MINNMVSFYEDIERSVPEVPHENFPKAFKSKCRKKRTFQTNNREWIW